MAKEQKHIIKTQIIELEIENGELLDSEEIAELQKRFIQMFIRVIGEEMDKVFSRLAPPDLVINLDKLEIDLGEISALNMERDIELLAAKTIEKALKQKLAQVQGKSESSRNKRFTKADVMQSFLQRGHFPIWADVSTETPQAILQNVLKTNPEAIARMVLSLGKRKSVFKRLMYQFSNSDLQDILRAIFGEQTEEAFKHIKEVKKRLLKNYPGLSKNLERNLIEGAFQYAFVQKGKKGTVLFEEKQFLRALVENAQRRRPNIGEEVINEILDTGVRPEYTKQFNDLDLLQYFLRVGSIPIWAEVSSKESLQTIFERLLETKLVKVQELLENNQRDESFTRRLVMQFPRELVLQLLEPTTDETLVFIEQISKELKTVVAARVGASAAGRVEQLVLQSALQYFFGQRKTRFVKQTFLRQALEKVAGDLQTTSETLLKETYKSVVRHAADPEVKEELSNILASADSAAIQDLTEEIAAIEQLQKEQKEVEVQLEEAEKRLQQGEIPEKELTNLLRRLGQIEYQLQEMDKPETAALSNLDSPLDTLLQEREQLDKKAIAVAKKLRQPQRLQEAQIKQLEKSKEEFEEKLSKINLRFRRFQLALVSEVAEQLNRYRQFQAEARIGSDSQRRLAAKKLDKSRSRLARLQNDLTKAIDQLQRDKRSLELRVMELQSALRTGMPAAERRVIEQEIARIRKQLQEMEERIQEMQATQKQLRDEFAPAPQRTAPDKTDLDEESSEPQPSQGSKLDFLLSVLQFGSVPWWAAAEYRNSSIEDILMEAAKENAPKLRQAFQQAGKYPIVWERLVNQLSDESLENLIDLLQPGQSGLIITQALMLERIHQSGVFPVVSATPIKYFMWSKVVEVVLSRSFTSVKNFVKEVVLAVAKEYNLSPNELLGYLGNIARNVSEARYSVFQNILPEVEKEKEVVETQEEFEQISKTTPISEAERIVDEKQKLEWLVSFLQSAGNIPDTAKESGWESIKAMERLLLEQMESNPQAIFNILTSLLSNAEVRRFVVQKMRPELVWELVQFVNSKTILVLQSYLSDLGEALGDKQLFFEKEILLDYAVQSLQRDWSPKEFMKFLLQYTVQQTRRTPIAVLEDWKHRLMALGSRARSSALLSVLALQVEWLQSQQKKSGDTQEIRTMQERIEQINQEFSALNQNLLPVLQRESEALRGIPEEAVSIPGLFERIRQMESELKALRRELEQLPQEPLLPRLELQRQMIQLQTQIEIWERKKPAAVRLLEPLMEEIRVEVDNIQRQLMAVKGQIEVMETEMPPTPTPTPPSLPEQKILLSTTAIQADIRTWQREVAQADDNDLPFLERLVLLLRRLIPDAPTEQIRQEYQQLLAITQEKIANTSDSIETLETQEQSAFRSIPEALVQLPLVAQWQRNISQALAFIRTNLTNAPIAELLQQWQTAQQAQQQWTEWMQSNRISLDISNIITLQNRWLRVIRQQQLRRRAAQLPLFRDLTTALLPKLRQAASEEELQTLETEIQQAQQTQFSTINDWQQEAWDEQQTAIVSALQTSTRAIFDELIYELRQRQLFFLYQKSEKTDEVIQLKVKEWEDLDKQRTAALETADLQAEKQKSKSILNAEHGGIPKELKAQQQLPQKKVPEPLLVKNAGLVILSPYISRLFKLLNYTDGKAFLSEDAKIRAIHILQYLATGQTSTPENELVLNKVMCAVPITTPVPISVDFTEEELKVADGLLMGAIANWAKMKTMSPAALRGTFIIRTGSLIDEADRWRLKVDKGAYDIVLKTLPWGYTFVKYMWMEKFITVEWGDAPPPNPGGGGYGGTPTK